MGGEGRGLFPSGSPLELSSHNVLCRCGLTLRIVVSLWLVFADYARRFWQQNPSRRPPSVSTSASGIYVFRASNCCQMFMVVGCASPSYVRCCSVVVLVFLLLLSLLLLLFLARHCCPPFFPVDFSLLTYVEMCVQIAHVPLLLLLPLASPPWSIRSTVS